MPKTAREERAEELERVYKTFSKDFLDELDGQGKKVAANLLFAAVGQGSQGDILPAEFIYGVCDSHDLAVAWAVAEGYATLTDKALATEDELAERRKQKEEREANYAGPTSAAPSLPSKYL